MFSLSLSLMYWLGFGRGLVALKLAEATSSFITGRLKAAILFCSSGDFRCRVLLFIVILVIFKYRNR